MNLHRIHRVAKLTGLTKDVIRVWERRYGLVKPTRGANRYRNYSDDEVLLLRFLKGELDKGYSIGELAELGREELLARARDAASPARFSSHNPYARLIEQLLLSLHPLDKVAFEKRLNGAIAIVPFEEAVHLILFPLQEQVGQLWHDGQINVAVEHYVTRQIQQKIYSVMNQLPAADSGPRIVVACPPEEDHELAALAVAYRCRMHGSPVYYLGANVPIPSLVNLCRSVEPDLVILSLPLAFSQASVPALIQALASEVRPHANIAVGGHGAVATREQFERSGIEVLEDFTALDKKLEALTKRSSAGRH